MPLATMVRHRSRFWLFVGVVFTILVVYALILGINAGKSHEEKAGEVHDFPTREAARAALGAPTETMPISELPARFKNEFEGVRLNQRGASFDKFTQFRGSSPVTRGVYWLYVIYDGEGKVVYSFRQFVD